MTLHRIRRVFLWATQLKDGVRRIGACFKNQIEVVLKRRVRLAKPGRPRNVL